MSYEYTEYLKSLKAAEKEVKAEIKKGKNHG